MLDASKNILHNNPLFFLHLATCLHVVNLYAHDLVIIIYVYLHEEGIS